MLRSLVVFNQQPIDDNDRDFSDSKLKLNLELVKSNSHCLSQKPRSLQYSFITDLYNESSYSADSDSNWFIDEETNYSSDLENSLEANNYFEKVRSNN